jgi:GH43 family beta-xylosidase
MPLTMRTASTLAGLHDAAPRSVWNGSSPKGYWAPELHYWAAPYSTWFLYTVYDGGRIQVLRSHTGRADGPFVDAGLVTNAGNGSAAAIDPNVLHHPSGKKYLLVKGERMWLTELAKPWATIGPSLQLPCIKCPLPGNQWFEAPATWVRGDKIWLMYSRCNTGPNYEIMLAYCDTSDDVMQASSWHHFSDEPVVRGNGGDTTGPGHSGWFSSPSGAQTWIVYHGTAVGESGRSSRAMEVPFNSTGWPIFPSIPPLGKELPEPS